MSDWVLALNDGMQMPLWWYVVGLVYAASIFGLMAIIAYMICAILPVKASIPNPASAVPPVQAIPDARVRQYAEDPMMCNTNDEQKAIAAELLALRHRPDPQERTIRNMDIMQELIAKPELLRRVLEAASDAAWDYIESVSVAELDGDVEWMRLESGSSLEDVYLLRDLGILEIHPQRPGWVRETATF